MDLHYSLLAAETEQCLRDRLVRSAAHAAACNSAAFYDGSGSDLVCLSSFGPDLTPLPEPARALARKAIQLATNGVLVINDARQDRAGLPPCSIGFLAAIPVKPAGVLLVADLAPHAGLSPAQHYILVTHALQFEAAAKADGPLDAGIHARAERLRLLESVVVNANDAILITEAEPIDLPGPRIVYCNAAFTRTTGYTEAEILGLTPRILQSSKVDRQALRRLRQALEKWEPVEVELLNTRKDGTEFWVELSIVPVADETGWFTHWVSVQRDVSQRRVAEEIATRARIAEAENRALEAEIRERKLIEEQLLYAAFHDDLTHLHNRAHLMERLTTLIGPADRGHGPDREHGPDCEQGNGPEPQCSILFLDLDRFKLINDSLGHRAGDLLLIEVARRLRGAIRPDDTLVRVGGDEFAVLIEGPDAATSSVHVAEAIIEALSRPVSLGKEEVFTACSVGIAHASGQYTKPEELLRDADIAMYAAKKQGGKAYAVYNSQMHAGAVELFLLQTDLRHAIARSEFRLDYQPIFNATTGQLIAVEALVRWDHPSRGLIGPTVFIPIAEEIGVIREIGRWVIRESCGQLQRWQTLHGAHGVRLSINVSGDELRAAGFISELHQVLHDLALDGDRLQLEITESVFLRQPALIAGVLADIRALGVKVALDDFGTGYSSLGYLDRYQFDTLKIDRSFVVRMLRQNRAMAIMEGIVRLGSALQLDIVAEGVETEDQLAMLRSLGCANVQGFLLAPPMSAREMTATFSEVEGLQLA